MRCGGGQSRNTDRSRRLSQEPIAIKLNGATLHHRFALIASPAPTPCARRADSGSLASAFHSTPPRSPLVDPAGFRIPPSFTTFLRATTAGTEIWTIHDAHSLLHHLADVSTCLEHAELISLDAFTLASPIGTSVYPSRQQTVFRLPNLVQVTNHTHTATHRHQTLPAHSML